MKEKKRFKMPHLMVMVVGLILIMSALTYILPAGQFAVDPVTGKIDGSNFSFLGYQTPVSPWQALLCPSRGLPGSRLSGWSLCHQQAAGAEENPCWGATLRRSHSRAVTAGT